eukprot:GEMP01016069.1.p1 GENE.GEMP01016069.1~~GEMP01016069.1.p1  ORF type:complete len:695 (+),score=235.98 GEMP01016069.1:167-2251(+)
MMQTTSDEGEKKTGSGVASVGETRKNRTFAKVVKGEIQKNATGLGKLVASAKLAESNATARKKIATLPASFSLRTAAKNALNSSAFMRRPVDISLPTNNPDDLVPPAVAKEVIQNYLLPLFERKGIPIPGRPPSVTAGKENNMSFLHELRLSDQLLVELGKTKKKSLETLDNLKKSEKLQVHLKKDMGELISNSQNVILELKMLRFQESNVQVKTRSLERACAELQAKLKQQMETLNEQKKENYRLSRRLFEEERQVERLSQVVAQNQNASSLSKLTNDVLAEQVKNLHSAVTTLSDLDSLQSQLVTNRVEFSERMNNDHATKEYAEITLARMVDERNYIDTVKRELLTNEQWLVSEHARLTNELEEQKTRGQADLMALFDEKECLRKERDKIEKKLKDVGENRDKLKQKMKKYRARRTRFDHQESKTCKKCGKDYGEADNFNWSCRTHQSDFGGEMWWCCGKLGKGAIGCKFAKHESKEDDDDLDEQERKEKAERDIVMRNLNVRCYSCAEVGHKSRDCTRDPNLRTNYQQSKELSRISQLALASRKLVRLMGGKEVAALVNSKCGYDVLGNAAKEETIDKPFASLVDWAWTFHRKKRMHGELEVPQGSASGSLPMARSFLYESSEDPSDPASDADEKEEEEDDDELEEEDEEFDEELEEDGLIFDPDEENEDESDGEQYEEDIGGELHNEPE